MISFIYGIQVFVFAQVFSIDIPLITFILIVIISDVVTGIIPITIGGLGVREGAFMVILLSYNVAPEISFVVSLSGYFVKMLIPAIIGLILSFKEKIKFDSVKNAIE